MKVAILSDIHSNLEALEAVLKDLEEQGGAEEVWFLGDLVGYGPNPKECIARISELSPLAVAGNHDWGALGKLDLRTFNPAAAAACRWNGAQLGEEERRYLESLPLTLVRADFTLAHGSPRDPIWEYLLSPREAALSFAHFATPYCLVGHSHYPCVFEASPGGPCRLLPFAEPLKLEGRRLIVNPGGVGQPRDGDPRAAYAIYGQGQAVLYPRRVPYDIAATQRKMLEKGLPLSLAQRLSLGL